jgi:hypothetical protein
VPCVLGWKQGKRNPKRDLSPHWCLTAAVGQVILLSNGGMSYYTWISTDYGATFTYSSALSPGANLVGGAASSDLSRIISGQNPSSLWLFGVRYTASPTSLPTKTPSIGPSVLPTKAPSTPPSNCDADSAAIGAAHEKPVKTADRGAEPVAYSWPNDSPNPIPNDPNEGAFRSA